MIETGPSSVRRALPVGLFLLAILGVLFLVPWFSRLLNLHMIAGSILGQAAFLTVTLLFAALDGQGFGGMGLTRRWEGKDWLLMLAVMATHLGGSVLVGLIMLVSESPEATAPSAAFDLLGQLAEVPLLTFAGVAFLLAALAGVGEELLFRGYLMTRLERTGLPGWAIIMGTGLLFGMMHATGYGLIPALSKALFFGIPTAAYFWYRRRLAPLMLLHFLVDFGSFSLVYVAANLLKSFSFT